MLKRLELYLFSIVGQQRQRGNAALRSVTLIVCVPPLTSIPNLPPASSRGPGAAIHQYPLSPGGHSDDWKIVVAAEYNHFHTHRCFDRHSVGINRQRPSFR